MIIWIVNVIIGALLFIALTKHRGINQLRFYNMSLYVDIDIGYQILCLW